MRKLDEYKSDFNVLRSHLLPINFLTDYYELELTEGKRAYLKKIFEIPIVNDAIFLASKDLYDQLNFYYKSPDNSNKLNKVELAFYKYFVRMCTRSTPFGLFAGISQCEFDKNTSLTLKDFNSIQRKVRLDMQVLILLTDELNKIKEVKESVLFYPNSSLYIIGNQVRYVKQIKGIYELIHITPNVALLDIIEYTKGGYNLSELITRVELVTGMDFAIVSSFVEDLIVNQILVSELNINITGNDCLSELIFTLKKYDNCSIITDKLDHINRILSDNLITIEQINENVVKILVNLNLEININIDFDALKDNFLQVDYFRPLLKNQLSTNIHNKLALGLGILSKLTEVRNSLFSEFKNKFRERYEMQEVKLVEVLDSDFGIGYKSIIDDKNELIKTGIFVSNQYTQSLAINEISNFKFILYKKSLSEKVFSIELDDKDLNKLPAQEVNLADSISIMFSNYNLENTEKIHIKNVGGHSSTNLVGRFSYLDKRLNTLVINQTQKEQQLYEDRIFVEIVHLPVGRVGNILFRSHLRNYEINYLCKSTLEDTNKINVDDLYLSLQNNNLILRSKKLNKIIVPRLSSAHNFSTSDLPLYRFLCDFQYEGITANLSWNWDFLSNEPFLPRITYKSLILSLATWNLDINQLLPIVKMNQAEKIMAFENFKVINNLPDFVVQTSGDNELLLNLNKIEDIDILLNLSKKNPIIKLIESFYNTDSSIVTDGNSNQYNNEFVIPYISIKKQNLVNYNTGYSSQKVEVNRIFCPGDEWFYFKIYCSPNLADSILLNTLEPFVKQLINEGIISTWFFIRYNDPNFHIRVRLHIVPAINFNALMADLESKLKPLIANKLVSNFVIDTYFREIERYGSTNIDTIEKIFFDNSELVLKVIGYLSNSNLTNYRFYFGLALTKSILESASVDINEYFNFVNTGDTNFSSEFNLKSNKLLREEFSSKYRSNNETINFFLSDTKSKNFPVELKYVLKDFNNQCKLNLIDPLGLIRNNTIGTSLYSNIILSIVHMFLNRLFISKSREQEFMVYHFLNKFSKSQIRKDV